MSMVFNSLGGFALVRGCCRAVNMTSLPGAFIFERPKTEAKSLLRPLSLESVRE